MIRYQKRLVNDGGKELFQYLILDTVLISSVLEFYKKCKNFFLPNFIYLDYRRLEASSGEAEEFFIKVEFKIVIPDDLKLLLVEENEAMTKNKKLPSLPMRITVDKILNDYVESQETDKINDFSR